MLNIITCFESGIEAKCVALYRSIDRFLTFSDGFRVLGITPRGNQQPSSAALFEAQSLGVECVTANLNIEFAYYPLANKPLSCAYASNLFPGESYLFLDSDTLFLRPIDLGFVIGEGMMGRPVDSANIGISSLNDPNGAYWAYLYKDLGVRAPRQITPSRDAQTINEYYNSGFIFFDSSRVIEEWNRLFCKTMRSAIRPNEGLFFVEQSVLSAVISSLSQPIRFLPSDVNYPIHMHFDLPERSKIQDVTELRHIHYHHYFDDEFCRKDLFDQLGFGGRSMEMIEMLDWQSN